jgi:chromosome segregation ATPase
MKKFSNYLELVVEQKDFQPYIYDEGKITDFFKNVSGAFKNINNIFNNIAKDISTNFTQKVLQDISSDRNKLKSELYQVQADILSKYEETLINKLQEEDIEITKPNNKKFSISYLTQKSIINAIDKKLKEKLKNDKEKIKKIKESIDKIKTDKTKQKKLNEIKEIQLNIEDQKKEFDEKKKEIEALFLERKELLLNKQNATQEQIKAIDEKIKNNSVMITKLSIGIFVISSYLIQYFINKFSGFY